MRTGILVGSTVLFLMLFHSFSSVADVDPLQEFLSEDIDPDDVLSDIPTDFDIIRAGKDAILRLHCFSPAEAERLIAFRDSLPRYADVSSLAEMPGLTPLQRLVLLHIIENFKPGVFPSVTEIRSGYVYSTDFDEPSDGKYYSKSSVRTGKALEFNLLGERDALEPRALDFCSGSMTMRSERYGVFAVLGDYIPGYGQGLVFSRYGRSYAGGTDIYRNENAVGTLTFFDESRYLRGLNIGIARPHFSSSVCYSIRNIDATLNDDGDALTVRSSGYHYSGDPRGNLDERIAAARFVVCPVAWISLGLTGSSVHYSPGFVSREGERGFNDVAGDSFGYVSFDGSIEHNGITWFFENAVMDGDARASIGGIKAESDLFRAALSGRRYDTEYRSLRSSPVSSFGECSNEQGVYGSFEVNVKKVLRMNASLDLAETLKRTYTDPMPDSKRRFAMSAEIKLSRSMLASLTSRSTDDDFGTGYRRSISMNLTRTQKKSIIDSWRLCCAGTSAADSQGLFAEAGSKIIIGDLTCDFSLNTFDIPSYDSRLYRYARNVPGRGSVVAYWGRGWSGTTVVRYGFVSARFRIETSSMNKASREFAIQVDHTL